MSPKNQNLLPFVSRWILAPVTLVVWGWASLATAETWTSLRGTHSVEAEMIGLWNGNVILELSGGRRVSVKLSDLRSESRIQAQELAKGLVSSRGERVKELQDQAAAAAAPAPDPLPKPPPAPEYRPPQKDAQPNLFLQQIEDAVLDGHLLAVYDALPPSYRNDVNEIVKLTAQKVSPAAWQALVATTQQIGDLIVTKQRWLLSSPRIQALPPDQLESMEGPFLTFAGLLREGLDPQAMQLQTLQTMDFGQWLAERDKVIAPHLARLFQQAGVDTGRQFTVESQNQGSAVVSIESDGGTSKITLTLVDGYWVPKTLADTWAESVAQRKSELAQAPPGSLLESYAVFLQPIAPSLGPLQNAGDAGQFHAALESLFVPVETLASTLMPMIGEKMNLASRGGRGGYGGYDDYEMEGMDDYEMEMEMDMEMDMEMEMEMEMDMEEGAP